MERALGRLPRRMRVAGLLLLALPAGCGYLESKRLLDRYGLENNDVLLTGAEYRAVVSTRVARGDYRFGHVIPRNIRCAEPSPDIAKAISDALSTAVAAEVQKGGASGQIDVRLSRETSEAFAQLGERLATIQLLRDGLFRACEAYANGAIGAVNYGAILSAYDDLTVTLMAAEMTAGAFGRGLAAASATAAGTANTAAYLQATRRAGELKGRIDGLTKSKEGKPDDEKAKIDEEIAALTAERTKQEAAAKALEPLVAAERDRGGTAFSPAAAIAAARLGDSSSVATAIQAIHAKYIDKDGNRARGAIAMACVNALSRVDGRIVRAGDGRFLSFRDEEPALPGQASPKFDDRGYSIFTKFCAQNLRELVAGGNLDDVKRRLSAIEARLAPPRRRAPAPRQGDPKTPAKPPTSIVPPKSDVTQPERAPTRVTLDEIPLRAMERRMGDSMCALLAAGMRQAKFKQAVAGACRKTLPVPS